MGPQVLPVVGPVVTVPSGRRELLVVVVVEPVVVVVEPVVVAVVVEPVFWLAWLTDLLVARGAGPRSGRRCGCSRRFPVRAARWRWQTDAVCAAI